MRFCKLKVDEQLAAGADLFAAGAAHGGDMVKRMTPRELSYSHTRWEEILTEIDAVGVQLIECLGVLSVYRKRAPR